MQEMETAVRPFLLDVCKMQTVQFQGLQRTIQKPAFGGWMGDVRAWPCTLMIVQIESEDQLWPARRVLKKAVLEMCPQCFHCYSEFCHLTL